MTGHKHIKNGIYQNENSVYLKGPAGKFSLLSEVTTKLSRAAILKAVTGAFAWPPLRDVYINVYRPPVNKEHNRWNLLSLKINWMQIVNSWQYFSSQNTWKEIELCTYSGFLLAQSRLIYHTFTLAG